LKSVDGNGLGSGERRAFVNAHGLKQQTAKTARYGDYVVPNTDT
jgi:hypothetical protein